MSTNLRFTHLAAIALAATIILPISAVAQSTAATPAAPAPSAPTQAAPAPAAPTQAAPTQAAPTQAAPAPADPAQTAPAQAVPAQAVPDNSANNKVQNTTADQQKQNPADMAITQNIRKAIMADKNLSTDAHNVKIVTIDGAVTLAGPVKSEDEKKRVEELANGVLKGSGSLTNSITVKS